MSASTRPHSFSTWRISPSAAFGSETSHATARPRLPAPPLLPDGLHGLAGLLPAGAVADGHGPAGLGEGEGDGPPDPPCPPRDHGHPLTHDVRPLRNTDALPAAWWMGLL